MYQKFAALRGWRFEVMHLALTETGGCKHGSAAISGRWFFQLQMAVRWLLQWSTMPRS